MQLLGRLGEGDTCGREARAALTAGAAAVGGGGAKVTLVPPPGLLHPAAGALVAALPADTLRIRCVALSADGSWPTSRMGPPGNLPGAPEIFPRQNVPW